MGKKMKLPAVIELDENFDCKECEDTGVIEYLINGKKQREYCDCHWGAEQQAHDLDMGREHHDDLRVHLMIED